MIARLLLLALLVGFLPIAAGGVHPATAHYVPRMGDRFQYAELIALGSGAGNYTGYTESTSINGNVTVTGVNPNGTESAMYGNVDDYQNNTGASERWTSSGSFTFSAVTFRYVRGTDNQTGYVNPFVWFYMNDSLPVGGTFYSLNTQMTLLSTGDDYHLGTGAGNYVTALSADGSGTFPRNDAYGRFTATYDWKEYFDPATGYVVGYVYTEQDSDPAGDGFRLTDTLGVTATTYPLTAGATPAPAATGLSPIVLGIAIGVALVLVLVIVVLVIVRARRRHPLPVHSPSGQVTFSPPPLGPPPAPISLTPAGQPPVQQVVIRETVKVNCKYCGSLIDSTAPRCPFCGATRS